jgi:hypothetical protein
MSILRIELFFVLSLFVFSSCSEKKVVIGNISGKIHLIKEQGKWTLYRNAKPYFIRGAHGAGDMDMLKKIGGNSVIVYHNQTNMAFLDRAHALDISVSVVLDIHKVRFGYDYTDNAVIIPQRNMVLDFVKKYKDHPAILFWIIGNEAHIMRRNNIALWKEVNVLSGMIHEIDPDHLTTSTVASYPTKTYDPLQIRVFAPDLDFISLNIYEFAHRVKRERKNIIWGTDRPYMISEWGAQPYWTMENSEWGAIIEPHSSTYEKTQQIIQNYAVCYERDAEWCFGTYVFYFGEKQERTHTSFSLLLHGKYKTQALESVEYCWKKEISGNLCPRITYEQLETEHPYKSMYLKTDSIYAYNILAEDPESEPLTMAWEIRREGAYFRKFGGQREPEPEYISGMMQPFLFMEQLRFRTPQEEGAYRLFIYIYDTSNNAAYLNMPFYALD